MPRIVVGNLNIQSGQRNGSEILYVNDGYYYHKHVAREGSNLVFIRCIKRHQRNVRCRGRAVVSRDGRYYRITQNHTGHPREFLLPLELELRQRIYDRISLGDATPFSIVVREEGQRGGFPIEVRSRITAVRLRTAMFNQRARYLPSIPRNLAVLGVYLSMPRYSQICKTLDGQDSIYAGFCGLFAEGTVSVVFISQRMMNFLVNQNKVFADGTFRKRAKKPKSSQIFSISCIWENAATRTKHTITVVRVFMQRRSQRAYTVLFNYLKQIIPLWNPQHVMCDHERGQVNGWMQAFPYARIETCLWHYAVAVFRYAKSLNMKELMEHHWVLDSIVRCCCAIPLLPNYMMTQGLLSVAHWARVTGYMRLPCTRALFSYINREWLNRWQYLSVCGSEDRTNNVSESSNAYLGWDLRQDRPNVYELIGTFVRHEDQFAVDIHALSDGRDASRARRVTSISNDVRIRNITDSLLRNQITILHFLRSASRTLQAPYDHVYQVEE